MIVATHSVQTRSWGMLRVWHCYGWFFTNISVNALVNCIRFCPRVFHNNVSGIFGYPELFQFHLVLTGAAVKAIWYFPISSQTWCRSRRRYLKCLKVLIKDTIFDEIFVQPGTPSEKPLDLWVNTTVAKVCSIFTEGCFLTFLSSRSSECCGMSSNLGRSIW